MGWQWTLYRALSHGITIVGPIYLRRRLAAGREHPAKWREKLGEASALRPDGRLVWVNAVGLGEVLSARGLIAQLHDMDPQLHFLITSSSRASADVLNDNLPPKAVHQFLPLDGPGLVARFLRHWRPDLSVWIEQDLWPNAVDQTARAGVPLAMVNARITDAAYRRRRRALGIYARLLPQFALIAAQDQGSADHLRALGAGMVQVRPSIKAIAPALAAHPSAQSAIKDQLAARRPWLLASSWAEDEAVALRAHRALLAQDPTALLIIAPRLAQRGAEIAQSAAALGLHCALRSHSPIIPPDAQVYIADTLGEMGLWYRLCSMALIGGTFGPTEGHNPWEAVHLGCAVLHGPRTANFANDYSQLDQARAAICIGADTLTAHLTADHGDMIRRAHDLAAQAKAPVQRLAVELLDLIA